MTARILGIGTALPPTRIAQSELRDLFLTQPGVDRVTARLIRAAFDHSAIDTRHTVLPELATGGSAFIGADTRAIGAPLTGARNAVYAREAPALFATAARDAMHRASVGADAITHVVTASCTGFFAPGPEFRLVRDLGLNPTVERDHLGFLGCAAALPALRSAARICAVDPSATVLVVCGEICSIHLRPSCDHDQIVASAVFADGAAAAVVSGAAVASSRPWLELDRFATALTSDGEHDMAWTIGDTGFEMTLSAQVPRIVGREVRDALAPLLDEADGIDAWAVHPGGRSILDRVEDALDLDARHLTLSRDVLREHGNMSSATVLFILKRMLEQAEPGTAGVGETEVGKTEVGKTEIGETEPGTTQAGTANASRADASDDALTDGARALAVAFSPGLTVEAALMTLRVPTRAPAVATRPDAVAALAASTPAAAGAIV